MQPDVATLLHILFAFADPHGRWTGAGPRQRLRLLSWLYSNHDETLKELCAMPGERHLAKAVCALVQHIGVGMVVVPTDGWKKLLSTSNPEFTAIVAQKAFSHPIYGRIDKRFEIWSSIVQGSQRAVADWLWTSYDLGNLLMLVARRATSLRDISNLSRVCRAVYTSVITSVEFQADYLKSRLPLSRSLRMELFRLPNAQHVINKLYEILNSVESAKTVPDEILVESNIRMMMALYESHDAQELIEEVRVLVCSNRYASCVQTLTDIFGVGLMFVGNPPAFDYLIQSDNNHLLAYVVQKSFEHEVLGNDKNRTKMWTRVLLEGKLIVGDWMWKTYMFDASSRDIVLAAILRPISALTRFLLLRGLSANAVYSMTLQELGHAGTHTLTDDVMRTAAVLFANSPSPIEFPILFLTVLRYHSLPRNEQKFADEIAELLLEFHADPNIGIHRKTVMDVLEYLGGRTSKLARRLRKNGARTTKELQTKRKSGFWI
ncbi:hypothetical protein HDU84_007821 [Entophlyctis sp. JEL0112]|nr:hypothetical protein HDU84_007821 [Entophlyctis sp. JEL0112]